jgi:hypothetical protein
MSTAQRSFFYYGAPEPDSKSDPEPWSTPDCCHGPFVIPGARFLDFFSEGFHASDIRRSNGSSLSTLRRTGVHKDSVVACVRHMAQGKVTTIVKTFNTTTRELMVLSDWSSDEGATHIAMEATLQGLLHPGVAEMDLMFLHSLLGKMLHVEFEVPIPIEP